MKKQVKILLVFLLASGYSRAQENFNYSITPLVGKFVSHKNLRIVREGLQYGMAFDVARETFGKKYWQFAHNYPQMGLHFEAKNFGNNYVYGTGFTVIPYLEFFPIRTKRSWLGIRHGTGIAYVTKKYDVVSNPDNRLIGSAINATSFIGIGHQYQLSKRMDIKTGMLLTHISNGAVVLPNAGTNAIAVYSGIAYYPYRNVVRHTKYSIDSVNRKWVFRVGTAIGFYNRNAELNTIQKNVQGNLMFFRQHNTRFRTGIGLELGRITTKDEKVQPALYLEEEVQFKNVTTRYGIGAYLKNRKEGETDAYSKIGIAYFPFVKTNIPNGWYIGSALKAHGFRAAHIEVSSGFVF